MDSKVFMKYLTTVVLLLASILILNGCFMMFLPAMPMINNSNEKDIDPKSGAVVRELIEESVNDLVNNRGQYDLILLGEVEVVENFITVEKLRLSLLETLRSRNEIQVLTRDDSKRRLPENFASIQSSSQRPAAVLDVQLYEVQGEILLAMQLADLRSNQIVWSEVHARPIPETTREGLTAIPLIT